MFNRGKWFCPVEGGAAWKGHCDAFTFSELVIVIIFFICVFHSRFREGLRAFTKAMYLSGTDGEMRSSGRRGENQQQGEVKWVDDTR